MDFFETVRNRYSCRNYNADKTVDKALVERVVEVARLAPSAVNRQPWTFVAVTDKETRAKILSKSRPSFNEAPVLLVACGHHSDAWHRPSDNKDHTDVDVSIAVEHICLAATACGLCTCWVCSFDVEATRDALGLPDDVEPIALIPLGYAINDAIPEKKRKSLDEILKWEKF
ncbi:MAG: nitroreductase family protein [Muribaculaceae bacterium]|nr:nitroreductase family protein [Muribaculaceae bacterium]